VIVLYLFIAALVTFGLMLAADLFFDSESFARWMAERRER